MYHVKFTQSLYLDLYIGKYIFQQLQMKYSFLMNMYCSEIPEHEHMDRLTDRNPIK